MSKWEEAMWAELEAMAPEDRIVVAGEWITALTQQVLPALGKARRVAVVEVLAKEEWDALRLAETIGSRAGTIARLAEEGRAILRQRAS